MRSAAGLLAAMIFFTATGATGQRSSLYPIPATVPGVTPLQRFTANGTLLGDLARRREASAAPGAITLSSIFSPGAEQGRPNVQRRAGGTSSGEIGRASWSERQ